MSSFLRQSELRADISSLRSLAKSLSPHDTLGRIGLESRLGHLTKELGSEEATPQNLASTAIYFGGKPVIGSVGIEAEFAATAIGDFKDLVVKVWATSETTVATRGRIPNQDAARLHVTALLHGSMGFLIEEIDLEGTPLFPSPLKRAADDATKLLSSIPTASEEEFQRQLETLHPRVFASAKTFFNDMHRAEASVRLVDNGGDRVLNREAVDKAFVRLEESSLEEDPVVEMGLLIGIIPKAGRFEFKSESGIYREGKVAPTLSDAYLKRVEEEQGTGKWFRVEMKRKEVKRFGKTTTTYTLTGLDEIERPIQS